MFRRSRHTTFTKCVRNEREACSFTSLCFHMFARQDRNPCQLKSCPAPRKPFWRKADNHSGLSYTCSTIVEFVVLLLFRGRVTTIGILTVLYSGAMSLFPLPTLPPAGCGPWSLMSTCWFQNQVRQNREASVQVKDTWKVVEEMDFPRLSKLSLPNIEEPEDL